MGHLTDRVFSKLEKPNFLDRALLLVIFEVITLASVQWIYIRVFSNPQLRSAPPIMDVVVICEFLLLLILYELLLVPLWKTAKDFKRITGHWTVRTPEGYHGDQ
jgi:hypothetical protein